MVQVCIRCTAHLGTTVWWRRVERNIAAGIVAEGRNYYSHLRIYVCTAVHEKTGMVKDAYLHTRNPIFFRETACYVQQITSTPAFEAIRCLCCGRCPRANTISCRAWHKGERKQKKWEKQNWLAGPIQQISHMGYVEKACREKRRLRSEAQLSLRSTSCVEWPRYIEKGRKVRCWLGEQLLFFWGDFSCCINP